MSRTTTDAAVIGVMTGPMMRMGTTLGTAGGNGTAAKSKTAAGSAAETGTVTAAAIMRVLIAMNGTAGQAWKQHTYLAHIAQRLDCVHGCMLLLEGD